MAFCTQCGAKALEGQLFCTQCGSKLPILEELRPTEGGNGEFTPIPLPIEDPVIPDIPQSPKEKPRKKKGWKIALIAVLILALIGGGVFALIRFWPFSKTNVTLSNFVSDDHYFLCGEDNTVVFTIQVEGKADTIELRRNGSSAGKMKDNGKDGDEVAGDGIYTCTVNWNVDSDSTVIEEYQAKIHDVYSEKVSIYTISLGDVEHSAEDIARVGAHIRELEDEFAAAGTDEEKIESAKLVYSNVVSYFDELLEDGTIIEYTQDKNVFRAVFYGVTYVYIFDLSEDSQGSFSSGQTTLRSPSANDVWNMKNVISIQPYASELSSAVFDKAARRAGELYGYQLADNVDDEAVTIDFLKTLDQYDVIVWDGHGGHSADLHSFVGTGEPGANSTRYPKDTVGDRPRIISMGGRLCVTPYFFEEYYEVGDFDDALIFMGGCHTADDDYLANVFLTMGAGAYYGYKSSVYTGYNRNMTETLFKALTEMESEELGTKTVTAALREAKNAHGAEDPTVDWWHEIKVFFGWEKDSPPAVLTLFCEDENFRLLTPTGTLAGKVCEAADRITPIENAKIDIYKEGSLYLSLSSDEDGDYMVNLPVGKYRLDISANGYIGFSCYATVLRDTCSYTETFLMIVGEEDETGCAEGTIRHALTGETEKSVTITVFENWNNYDGTNEVASTSTGRKGEYSLELPLGNYTLRASKDGFVDCYFNIIVQSGVTDNQNGTITPAVSGTDFLITLTWDRYPEDLDAHVVGELSNGEEFHVDYEYSENRDYEPNYTVLDPPKDGNVVVCRLDCDDISSYGPEHITLHTTTDKPYYFFVHQYSDDGTLARSGAQVTIHQGNQLLAEFHVPTNWEEAEYWNVFAIVDGEVVVSNSITGTPDLEYAD